MEEFQTFDVPMGSDLSIPTAKRLVARFYSTNSLLQHLPAFLKTYTVDLSVGNSSVRGITTVSFDLKKRK